jgi:hypothetical protein
MRTWIIGAAALLAVALPGVAMAQTTANVGASYANHEPDSGGDVDNYGLDVAFSHDFGNGWAIQGDGAVDRLDFGGSDVGVSYGAINLGMRNDSHSIYGFVGLSDVIASSSIAVGVGGQLNISQAVINGSVSHLDIGDALITDANLTNAHLDATFFLTDDFGITGEVGWSEAEGTGSDVDWTTLGIGATYRFTGTPWRLYAGYQNRDADFGELDTIRVGVSFAIGTSTAREEAQRNWNGARALYDETRAFATLF